MRWIKRLLIVLAACLAIIGIAVAFVLTLDLNDYKQEISALVERQTGRTLTLDGRVDLDLGMLTTLELTNARLGNPAWASQPYMAQITRGKLVVDLRSLWRGPVVVEQFELHASELHLEERVDGTDNWTFGDATTNAASHRNDGRSDAVVPLVLRHVQAQDFLFTLTIPALPRTLSIHADQLTQAQRDDGQLDAKISGTLNEKSFSVAGQYGPLSNLLAATSLTYDVDGKFDTLSLRSKGLIDDLTHPRRPTLDLEVSGPALDDVTGMLGLPDLGDGGLNLTASVKPDTDGLAADVSGSVGEYVTDTKARAKELTAFEHFSLTTSVKGPDLGKAMRIFGVDDVPGGPFELAGGVARNDKQLDFDSVRLNIGSAVITLNGQVKDFRNIDDAHLKLQVHGDDVEQFRDLFGLPGAATGPFRIDADLNVQTDGAELLDAVLQTEIASVKVDGAITGKAPAFVGTTLKFDGKGKNLADFTRTYGIPYSIDGPFAVTGEIELGDQQLRTLETISLAAGGETLAVDGTIGFEPLERGTDIQVRATGPNLAQITALAGLTEYVPAVAYELRGGLAIGADGYRVRNLDAKVGKATLKLDGLISRSAGFKGTRATVSAQGPDLAEILQDTESLMFADGPFDVSGNVELLADALHLRQVRVTVAGANATADVDIGMPLESGSGRFDVSTHGPNLHAVVRAREIWTPPEAPFDVTAKGTLDDGLWSFDVLTAKLGQAQLRGSGVFDQPPDLSRTRLTINMKVSDLAALGTFGTRKLPSTSASLEMNFEGSPESFSIDPFTAALGPSDLAGSVIVDLTGEVPVFNTRLKSNVLNLDSLLQGDKKLAAQVDDTADESADAAPKSADGRLIPDWSLPLESLKKLDAKIDIDATTIIFRGRKNTNFSIDGEIRDGRLVVQKATADTGDGEFTASLNVTPTTSGADVKMQLEGTGIYLGLGPVRSAEDIAQAPKFAANIDLTGSGRNLRELAAGLDGKFRMTNSGGRFANSGLRLLFGNFFQEVLSAVNPFVKKDPYTHIACLVLLINVDGGVLSLDPGLVMQTDKITVAATGDVSLKTETVDIGFRTAPRSRVSISAGELVNPYLKIGGTMLDPRLTMDPTGALVTSATLGMSAVASGLWNRMFRSGDPCGAAIEAYEKGKKKKFLGVF